MKIAQKQKTTGSAKIRNQHDIVDIQVILRISLILKWLYGH